MRECEHQLPSLRKGTIPKGQVQMMHKIPHNYTLADILSIEFWWTFGSLTEELDQEWGLFLRNNTLQFYLAHWDSISTTIITNPPPGSWCHVVGTYTKKAVGANEINIYLNGVTGTVADMHTFVVVSSLNGLKSRGDGTTNDVNACYDCRINGLVMSYDGGGCGVRQYNRVLSLDEITSRYQQIGRTVAVT